MLEVQCFCYPTGQQPRRVLERGYRRPSATARYETGCQQRLLHGAHATVARMYDHLWLKANRFGQPSIAMRTCSDLTRQPNLAPSRRQRQRTVNHRRDNRQRNGQVNRSVAKPVPADNIDVNVGLAQPDSTMTLQHGQ